MKVLGIETSCDETGVAVYDSQAGLLSDQLYSQVTLHNAYGGVVPELASRDHIRRISTLVSLAMAEANLSYSELGGIAYTQGPGLAGALLVGASFAKSLAFTLGIPALGIHHLEAHLLAPMLEEKAPTYPFIALLVSGGHTSLIQATGLGCYQLLGETLDDAVGEAFDKTAKLLGLPYPGGAALSDIALKGSPRFHFPRPMLDRPNLDFSFSGLKTHVANCVRQAKLGDSSFFPDVAFAFQEAVVDVLITKARRALERTGLRTLVVAGGVGANRLLREQLNKMRDETETNIFFPRAAYCTDNGAMVAYVGCQRLLLGDQDASLAITVRARWPLEELKPPSGLETKS